MDLVIVSDAYNPELSRLTQNCIDSFRSTCGGKIVVVEKQNKDYAGCVVLPQSQPFCYNACLNDGFLHTESDWVCFANNDVEFLPNWAELTKYDFDSMSPLNVVWQHHKNIKGEPIRGYGVGVILTGWCIIAKRKTIEDIGGFDTGVSFWFSDNIYSDQLIYHGKTHALVPESHIKHIASKTLFRSKDIAELTHGQLSKFEQAIKKYEKI
jgi:hypothetical protein